MRKVSIFTATHKKFNPPQDKTYIPIHVGREQGEDLGYLADNTGDNISDQNPCYSELTGLYWIWKNYRDADIVGLCHYRRYFLNNNEEIMTAEEYCNILEDNDIITSLAVMGDDTYYNVYKSCHNIKDLDAVGEAIKKIYPEYYSTFLEAVNGWYYYVGNLLVTTKDKFDSYCKWLFNIFDEAAKNIDVTGYDDYHKRVYGFLSEQLLLVWIKYNNLKVYEANIGIMSEKAETVEAKKIIADYFKEGNYNKAAAYLNEVSVSRPDISLEDSDIKKELPVMADIVRICLFEEQYSNSSFINKSNDIYELIKHYYKIENIVNNVSERNIEETDLEEYLYLKNEKVSCSAVIYFADKIPDLAVRKRLYNSLAVLNEKTGYLNAVLPFYDKALEINESDRDTLLNLSDFLDRLGEHELAVQYRDQIKE